MQILKLLLAIPLGAVLSYLSFFPAQALALWLLNQAESYPLRTTNPGFYWDLANSLFLMLLAAALIVVPILALVGPLFLAANRTSGSSFRLPTHFHSRTKQHHSQDPRKLQTYKNQAKSPPP